MGSGTLFGTYCWARFITIYEWCNDFHLTKKISDFAWNPSSIEHIGTTMAMMHVRARAAAHCNCLYGEILTIVANRLKALKFGYTLLALSLAMSWSSYGVWSLLLSCGFKTNKVCSSINMLLPMQEVAYLFNHLLRKTLLTWK